jgi:hypothetical protein
MKTSFHPPSRLKHVKTPILQLLIMSEFQPYAIVIGREYGKKNPTTSDLSQQVATITSNAIPVSNPKGLLPYCGGCTLQDSRANLILALLVPA